MTRATAPGGGSVEVSDCPGNRAWCDHLTMKRGKVLTEHKPMNETLRIGVIGAPHRCSTQTTWQQRTRRSRQPLRRIQPAAKELAGKAGHPAWYADYRKIIEDPDIERCSSVPLPILIPHLHRGRQGGKHIFCEKPIDHDLAKIEKVLEEVNKAGSYQVAQPPLRPQFHACRKGEGRGRITSSRHVPIPLHPISYVKCPRHFWDIPSMTSTWCASSDSEVKR